MERKSSAYLNSDDMFSTYAQETYMENIPCELAYRRVLEGADVGVLCSYVVKETGELGGGGDNHRPWTGDHYPACMQGLSYVTLIL